MTSMRVLVAALLLSAIISGSAGASNILFPTDLPELQWVEFSAAGFPQPVSGVIYRTEKPPCCGVPLGGIDTGCLDIDVRGVYGFSSIFNPSSLIPAANNAWMPRKLPRVEPILGLSVGGTTWVLATQPFIDGGQIPWCTEPSFGGQWAATGYKIDVINCPKIEGVQAAREIHYWGHYPVADMEFETDGPVRVGMRAWAPFIPGNTAVSNTPAAVFEVHLCNTTARPQEGTLAFNFPGPDAQEAMGTEFTREEFKEDFHGVLVSSTGGVNYILGVLGDENVRFGAGLNTTPTAWSKIAKELPQPALREHEGERLYQVSSSSAAVDFELEPGQEKVVRFLLTWYAPVWEGANNRDTINFGQYGSRWLASKWAGNTNYYTHMYAARYGSAVDVARRIAVEHESLLRRVLAWQNVIYSDENLPVWLRDALVNNLYLIAEDSYWAQAKPPLGDWAFPWGVFALNESPRGCPCLGCIPCDWYGNLPIVYFFPELARTTLRAFKQYQLPSGEVPIWLGNMGDLPDLATPSTIKQVSLNGTCYVDMIDRLWQRTEDDAILREFYDSAKACNTFTMNLKKGPGGVISMPEVGGMEWFEHGEWAGMATHMGGLRLAQLRIMGRMAEQMGDTDYVRQCDEWLADGTRAMEEEMWAGTYYLNFWEKETGKKSDDVMGYQLDGEWMARFHGLPGVFRPDRVKTTLETIKRFNVALTPDVGAANFVRPDGSPLERPAGVPGDVVYYGSHTMFTAELVVLAATYMNAGEKEFGLDLARRHWENLVCRQRHPWDAPNMVRGDTGERLFGTDYYQCMMLWALPASVHNTDLKGLSQPGGLLDRIIRAGSE